MATYEQLADECYRLNGFNIRVQNTREHELVMNRMAIGNVMTRELKQSVVSVGRHMKRDHSSIVHYRNEHYTRYKYDDAYKKLYDKLCNFILTSPDERYDLDNVISWIRQIGCATFLHKSERISCE
jgi:hypothetical protein